jgi:hypothetical protein
MKPETTQAIFPIAELRICIIESTPDDDPFWANHDLRNAPFPVTLQALAALACVSKDFREPTLNVLWRRLPSLTTLIRLLPPDVFCSEDDCWKLTTPNGAAVCH